MDLSTTYLGFSLKNPIVPSACGPLSSTVDQVKKLEDAGASAVVLYSLFEEQITHEENELEHYLAYGTESYAEALNYFPRPDQFIGNPHQYLEHIRQVKKSVQIPIIASLNGGNTGRWIHFAKEIEQAGADALELNIYSVPTDSFVAGSQIEHIYLEILRSVKRAIRIPVAVKISPYFSSIAHMIYQLDKEKADAVVLFNRFYQPDIDLETLEVVPHLLLSQSSEMRLPLRWIAILFGTVRANLAATTGIHTSEDVLKMIMVGADVAMMCSELLKNGTSRITQILKEIEQWLEKHEYHSLQQLKGSMSQKNVPEPTAFERAQYMKTLQSYKILP
jgi:dihydroorotate dehydrogenase (fumarate)